MPERPVIDFDHHSSTFAEDPWSVFAHLRSECPVAWTEHHGGYWVVSRYDDVAAIARDDHTFSSARGVTLPPSSMQMVPIEVDPPEFVEYRRVLNPFFSPAASEQLVPRTTEFTTRCIDAFIESGRADLIEDLANPVPAMVTLDLLGLNVDDWRRYAEPVHSATFTPPDKRPRPDPGMAWIGEQVYGAILDRRANPRDDMISKLVRAEISGGPISDERLLGMVMLVIIGGVDTTTAVIGNALLYLHRHHEARERLVRDPDLVEPAVEEFLRWQAPVQGLVRHCTKDVEVSGAKMRAGDALMLLWGSANRDADHFPDPDEVVLDRFPNRHLTFGVGAHRCLGSTIARNEVRIVLSEVLRRLPDYRILEDQMVRAETVGTVYGHVNMPTAFSPGPTTRPAPGATS